MAATAKQDAQSAVNPPDWLMSIPELPNQRVNSFMDDGRKPKKTLFEIPKAMPTKHGSLLLIPSSEDPLFGPHSQWFKTSGKWKKSSRQLENSAQETLKILTAKILQFGPDGREFLEFLREFAKVRDYEESSKPGSKPEFYLERLQKQLGIEVKKRDTLRYSVQNLEVDADNDKQRTPQIYRAPRHDKIQPFWEGHSDDSSDESISATRVKGRRFKNCSNDETVDCALFIPEEVAKGSQFLNSLGIKESEIARYDIDSGKGLDKLIFGDSQQKTSDETEKYDVSTPIPDVSAILSSLGTRNPTKAESWKEHRNNENAENGLFRSKTEPPGNFPRVDTNDGPTSVQYFDSFFPQPAEDSNKLLEPEIEIIARENRKNERSKYSLPAYRVKTNEINENGYQKRQRKVQTLLLRDRDKEDKSEDENQDLLEFNMHDLELMERDAKDIIKYLEERRKEEKERALADARALIKKKEEENTDNESKSKAVSESGKKKKKKKSGKASSKAEVDDSSVIEERSISRKGRDLQSALALDANVEESDLGGKREQSAAAVFPPLYPSRATTAGERRVFGQPGPLSKESTSVSKKSKKTPSRQSKKSTPALISPDPTLTKEKTISEMTTEEKLAHFEEMLQRRTQEYELQLEAIRSERSALERELSLTTFDMTSSHERLEQQRQQLREKEGSQEERLGEELQETLFLQRARMEAELRSNWDMRRTRAMMELEARWSDDEDRQGYLEDLDRVECKLQNREVEEEEKMEEAWEREQKRLKSQFTQQQLELYSSQEHERVAQLGPLQEQIGALERKKSDLELTIERLHESEQKLIQGFSDLEEWYQNEIAALRDKLASETREGLEIQEPIPPSARLAQMNRQRLESKRKNEQLYRDRVRLHVLEYISRAYLYSYFDPIPEHRLQGEMSRAWVRWIQQARTVPPVKGGGGGKTKKR